MAKKNVSRVKTKKKAPAKRGRKTYFTPDRIERICKVIAQQVTNGYSGAERRWKPTVRLLD